MDSDVANVLTDAKALMNHGKLHLSRGKTSRLDRLLAVHHAHHAVELVLRQKAKEKQVNPYDIPTAIKALKKHGVPIPYERELDELNRTRVLIQHYGQVPDEREAYRLVATSENFMREFCAQSFNVDYGALSMLDIISNDSIRMTLQEALDARKKGSYEDAIMTAHLAIEKAKCVVQDRILPRRHRYSVSLSTKRYLKDLVESVNEIRDELHDTLDVALSAPFAYDLKRLKEMTGARFHRTGDERIVARTVYAKLGIGEDESKPVVTSDDAEFALKLATEYILWAQQNYGL